jgi:biopolymer transport protein ExbD
VTQTGIIKSRRTARVAPDINITPLVDVVLVLLIIFMVVAPQMEQDIPVTLPGIFNPDPDMEGQAAPEMVTYTKEGEFHIDSQKYDLDGAVAQLSAVHAANPYKRLALRADAGLKYLQVREVFFRLQEVGFPGMSLMVSHRYQAGQNDASGSQPAATGESPASAGGESGDAHAEPAAAEQGAAPVAEPPAAAQGSEG